MQIIATHRERRREDGSLSIEAILLLGDVEYVLERNCASRRQAQHIADEELRLIRRLILARLRQLHTEKRPSTAILQTAEREFEKHLPSPISSERSEQCHLQSPTSPSKLNGKHPPSPRPNTISAEEL